MRTRNHVFRVSISLLLVAHRLTLSALETAIEVLRDPTRKEAYDRRPNEDPNPKNDLFGEDFFSDAFGSEAEDSEDDDESHQRPPPSAEIANGLEKLSKCIEAFFEPNRPDINKKAESKIARFNKIVISHNEKIRLKPDLYIVDVDILGILRQKQTEILEAAQQGSSRPEELQSRFKQLHDEFLKTCQLPIHQWPIKWVDLVMKVLQERLKSLGADVELDQTINRPKSGDDVDDGSTKGDKGDPMDEDKDHQADEEDDAYPDLKPNQSPPQSGYTGSGHRILGCSPQEKHYKLAGQTVLISCNFFIEVQRANPLYLAGMEEIGIAASQYLASPDKNDVRYSQTRYNARTLRPGQFKGIKGVVYHNGSTWVWIDMESPSDAQKPHIMTRTALRDWLGKNRADKLIEEFYEGIGQVPDWAKNEALIPRKRYMLRYPLPSRSSRTAWASHPIGRIGWQPQGTGASRSGRVLERTDDQPGLGESEANNGLEVRTRVLEENLDRLTVLMSRFLEEA